MNQDVEKLRALLADNSTAIDPQWLEQMKQRYPFFSLAECLQMRNNPNQFSQREREALVAKMTLTVSDSEALQRLVEEDGDRFDNFYPPTSTKAASTTNRQVPGNLRLKRPYRKRGAGTPDFQPCGRLFTTTGAAGRTIAPRCHPIGQFARRPH
jgi:hypothetical protein